MKRENCQQLLQTAVAAVHPAHVIPGRLRFHSGQLLLDDKPLCEPIDSKVKVIGFGKASGAMAEQIELLMGEHIDDGCVATAYGSRTQCRTIRIMGAGHPQPDENSLNATAEILKIIDQLTEHDLVLTLISGGGSAMLEKLPDGISLSDWQQTNRLLLHCGAAIDEINTVRKHISLVKGGQLARRIYPAKTVGLIISDVIGDRLEVIASGPTTADPSRFRDAVRVLKIYQLWEKLPRSVKTHLQKGLSGEIPDTPKPGDALFRGVSNRIIANNQLALRAMAAAAEAQGWRSVIMGSNYQGEARRVAIRYITEAVKWLKKHDAGAPTALFFGGETTVVVKGSGKGGRNQETALALLLQLQDRLSYQFFSAGTDGIDGPTDATGAEVSPETWQNALAQHLSPQAFLEANDSYRFFQKIGGHLRTGPTGTNVMDVAGLLLPDPRQLISKFET
jgi:glycerate-2-kinase